jgi:hypothetical protein
MQLRTASQACLHWHQSSQSDWFIGPELERLYVMNSQPPVESFGQLPVLMGGMLVSRKKQLSRSMPVSPIARICPAP